MSLQSQYPSYPYAPNPWIASVACQGAATNDPCAKGSSLGPVRGFGGSNGAAPWALGLAAGLTVLTASASSQLGSDENEATAIITAASATVFTTGAGVTGEQVAETRAALVRLAGVVRQVAYDAAIWNFSGRPVAPTAPVQIAAIAQPAAAAQVSSTGLLLALGVFALVAFFYLS